MEWLANNASTLIIGTLLLVAVIFAIRYLWKKAKAGQCVGCSECDGHHGTSGCHCSTNKEQ